MNPNQDIKIFDVTFEYYETRLYPSPNWVKTYGQVWAKCEEDAHKKAYLKYGDTIDILEIEEA